MSSFLFVGPGLVVLSVCRPGPCRPFCLWTRALFVALFRRRLVCLWIRALFAGLQTNRQHHAIISSSATMHEQLPILTCPPRSPRPIGEALPLILRTVKARRFIKSAIACFFDFSLCGRIETKLRSDNSRPSATDAFPNSRKHTSDDTMNANCQIKFYQRDLNQIALQLDTVTSNS